LVAEQFKKKTKEGCLGFERMKNFGPKSNQWLNAVGVYDISDLRKLGAIKVFLKVKNKGFPVSLNLLWALQGAIEDRSWLSFSKEEKSKLIEKLNNDQKVDG
jgi:DNA transformation protein